MKETFINNTLIEAIRTYKTTFTWTGEGVEDIVFGGLTHQHLLRTNIIDKTIIDCYASYTIELLTPVEIPNVPADYHSKIFSKALAPFPFVILGAYHSRFNLYWKLKSLMSLDNRIELNGNKNLNNFFDLKPYFSEYAVGFKDGHNDFEDDKISPYLLKFETHDREAYAIKVLEFLTNDFSEAPRTTSKKGFVLLSDKKREIVHAYQDGLLEGYIYRAWNIIFSNNALFAPFFKEYSISKNFIKKVKPELKKEDILKMQNNLIPEVSLEYVYDFFSILIKPNKNEKPYLSEQKLLTFIESTFVNEDPVPQSFDIPLNKIYIRSVFYKFQINCSDLERNQKKIKKKYYDIMNDGFKGFSDSDRHHWTRTKENKALKGKPKGNYLV